MSETFISQLQDNKVLNNEQEIDDDKHEYIDEDKQESGFMNNFSSATSYIRQKTSIVVEKVTTNKITNKVQSGLTSGITGVT